MGQGQNQAAFERAVEVVAKGRVVVLAGAGLLNCAGLEPPDRRGGLWDRFGIERCATPEALRRHPQEAWAAFGEYLSQTAGVLGRHEGPSAAHRALLTLFEGGLLRGVVCTTTDGLVRRVGVSKTAELFGAIDAVRCVQCRQRAVVVSGEFVGAPPRCVCGEALRPDMVLFGEPMPRRPRELAASWVYGGRSLLVLGADLSRPPLNRIPGEMFQEGGVTVVLGGDGSGLERIRGVSVEGQLGRLLPALVESLSL